MSSSVSRSSFPLSFSADCVLCRGEESCGGEDVEGVTSEHDTEEGAVGEGGSGDCEESTVGEGGSDETDKANVDEAPPTTQQSSKVTWQSLEPEWRRFNFDLIPKARENSIIYRC